MGRRVSIVDIAWAAGFIEGEGSFTAHAAAITISAVQVELGPLLRLRDLFCGSIRQYQNRSPGRHQPYNKWALHGSPAVAVAFTLFPFMSAKRRQQIHRMVAMWKGRPGRNNSLKTHCPRGHEYIESNLYRDRKGSRLCKQCYRTYYRTPQHLRVISGTSHAV